MGQKKCLFLFFLILFLFYLLTVESALKNRRSDGVGKKQIQKMIDEWSVWIRQYTIATQETYKENLSLFLRWSPIPIETIGDLSGSLIARWQIALMDRCAASTVNGHIAAVKSFCLFLAVIYDIDDPSIRVGYIRVGPGKQRFLTDVEYQQIADETGICRDRVVFLANTGLRVSEFCGLDRHNYGPESITFTGKGQKRRTVPLNKTALNLARKYKNRINFSKNGPIKRGTMLGYCYRIADHIGINRFSPHSLRHYFATALLTRGVSIQIVSKLLGHSSISITEKTYIHILPDHLAGVTDVLG